MCGATEGGLSLDGIDVKKEAVVQGQVTRTDQTPRPGTQLFFVNAATGARQSAVTNDAGRFTAPLASGNYYVYLASRDRGAAYHSQLQVLPNQPNFVTLVNQ